MCVYFLFHHALRAQLSHIRTMTIDYIILFRKMQYQHPQFTNYLHFHAFFPSKSDKVTLLISCGVRRTRMVSSPKHSILHQGMQRYSVFPKEKIPLSCGTKSDSTVAHLGSNTSSVATPNRRPSHRLIISFLHSEAVVICRIAQSSLPYRWHGIFYALRSALCLLLVTKESIAPKRFYPPAKARSNPAGHKNASSKERERHQRKQQQPP